MRVICLAAGVGTNGGVAEVSKFASAACRGERGCRECKIHALPVAWPRAGGSWGKPDDLCEAKVGLYTHADRMRLIRDPIMGCRWLP